MIESFLEARNVQKIYRSGRTSVTALASATCDVAARARIAVMGPSGSGKSTLLYLMGALEQPTSGTIAWPALGAAKTLRPGRVAFIFQSPSLLAPLNALENIEVPLLLAGVTTAKARQAAFSALERIAMLDIAEKMPEDLSGGQAQRIAAARALASGAKLILADEPSGQLDHPTADKLFDAFFAALEGTDVALVVATHDQRIGDRMRDVWRLEHGVLRTAFDA